jgi:hypothetical protein
LAFGVSALLGLVSGCGGWASVGALDTEPSLEVSENGGDPFPVDAEAGDPTPEADEGTTPDSPDEVTDDGAATDSPDVAPDVPWEVAHDADACSPACSGVECGDDGCSGTCGSCAAQQECVAGKCVQMCWPGPCPPGFGPKVDGCFCRVPPTGATHCSTDDDLAIDCSKIPEGSDFHGQDGHLTPGSVQFSDGVDGTGTATDQATGLVWSKDAYGPLKWKDASAGTFPAGDQCEQNVAGLPGTGWRLPSAWELFGFVDFSRTECPTWAPLFGPCPTPVQFWSSTPESADEIRLVYFDTGRLQIAQPVTKKGVRCVRGGPGPQAAPPARFIDVGEVVFDRLTGYEWGKKFDADPYDWKGALAKCLAMGGGWRLPNAREMASLLTSDGIEWKFPGPPFVVDWSDMIDTSDSFWTSTPHPDTNMGLVWPGAVTVNLHDGFTGVSYTTHNTGYHAECVRAGP